MIAKVMLTNAGFALSREFDYKVEDSMREKAKIGMRVIVPFGVRNKSEEAIITNVSDESKYDKLKSIKSLRMKSQSAQSISLSFANGFRRNIYARSRRLISR